jgi:hypothetical protein
MAIMSKQTTTYFETQDYVYACRKLLTVINDQIMPIYESNSDVNNQKLGGLYAKIIFPLIDSYIPLYRQIHRTGNDYKSRKKVFKKLKIRKADLIWRLYRHKTIHTNRFGILLYGQTLIIPQWTTRTNESIYYDEYKITNPRRYLLGDRERDISTVITLKLNIFQLIQEFKRLLETEIVRFPRRTIKVEKADRIYSKKSSRYDKKNANAIKDIKDILNDN